MKLENSPLSFFALCKKEMESDRRQISRFGKLLVSRIYEIGRFFKPAVMVTFHKFLTNRSSSFRNLSGSPGKALGCVSSPGVNKTLPFIHMTDPDRAMQMLARQQQRDDPQVSAPILSSYAPAGEQPAYSAKKTFRYLGSGSFGIAKHVVHGKEAGPLCVEKVYVGQDEERARKASYERKMMQGLDHPNIVKMINAADGTKVSEGVIDMEYGGATLKQYIDGLDSKGAYDTARLKSCMTQLLSALEYLESKGIVHMDVHPENVFINPGTGQIKLGDFGGAVDLNKPITRAGGTPEFMAPEIVEILSDKIGRPFDNKVDVFSTGAMLYKMLTGEKSYWLKLAGSKRKLGSQSKPDFYAKFYEACQKQIAAEPVLDKMQAMAKRNDFKVEPKNQQLVAELLAGMLEPDPTKRITPTRAKELVAKLDP